MQTDSPGALPLVASRDERNKGLEALIGHLNSAYNLARWLVRDAADAEDVVQDAYLRAIQHYRSFRGGNARAWLLAIVRNMCYDRLRQKNAARQNRDLDEAELNRCRQEPDAEHCLLLSERAESLRLAIAQLPAEYREAVVLREFEQLSYREISHVTGHPLGTIMSRLYRARLALQRVLVADMPDAECNQ